ncbi:hypothetical protein [uncultured Enterovirga sp.]|uniref:hypothetical protein n=1 Tax=uncultured Enterovirga sp. TaxID=2026352 RepID=UPI0035CAA373
MRATVLLLVAATVAAALSGCGYKPLKAPCAADEGGVATAFSSLQAPRRSELVPAEDSCGPMRPI